MHDEKQPSDILFYVIAIICGILSGILHVTIGDPLLTALAVLMSTMFLGFMRYQRPWRWLLIVGFLVPVVMLTANAFGYYRTLTRAGLYGSVLIMLPGIAGSYGGAVGRRFVRVMFQGKEN